MVLAGRRHTKILVGITLLVFLVSFIGIAHADMKGSPDGLMTSNCPFMSRITTLCQMSPLEHIAAWQSMFTAMPHQQDVLTTLLLLLASFAINFLLIRRAAYPPRISDSKAQLVYHRTRTLVVNPLQELFSSGILHPKIF